MQSQDLEIIATRCAMKDTVSPHIVGDEQTPSDSRTLLPS
jgi:hypothetical protein